MNRALPFIGIVLAFSVIAGCGSGGFKDDGIPAADKATAASANAIAVSVDGNFDKLTPDQKKQFITLAGGNEGQARRMVDRMAHPPVRGGGGPHPPGK